MNHQPRTLLTVALLLSLLTAPVVAETVVDLKFTPDGWDPAQWTLCKNPTVEYLGKWLQRPDCIENVTPDDPAKKNALDQTLTTMIYNQQFSGNFTASATFQIGAGSAPGILLVQDYALDAQGRPQYGEFYEVIIYEKGLNLWHHFPRDDKPTYEKTAYSNFALKPDTSYRLTVERKGKSVAMTVTPVGEQEPLRHVGILLNTLPNDLYLGVMGCEGVSRVYDFRVER
jgi:hypothetical protein